MLDSKDILINFGKFIRCHRIMKEITQQEVADAVGISQPQYYKIECGTRKVEFPLAWNICVFLQIDIKEFISDYIEKE